jgi:hypothetical protein
MGVERRAGERAAARYRPRRPQHSVLYRCVQQHLETWLAHCGEGRDDAWSVPEQVEREFRRYLDCGILARVLPAPAAAGAGTTFWSPSPVIRSGKLSAVRARRRTERCVNCYVLKNLIWRGS